MKCKFSLLLFTLIAIVTHSQAQKNTTLSLMSYNIRLALASDGPNSWDNRKEFLTGQLKFYEPAIFGLQEALPVQVKNISEALPNYSHVGIGRDGDNKGEASCIFYNKERFVVKQSSTFWLSATPDTISMGWDAAYRRVCTYALFKDKKTKKYFWVFNTHLDNKGEQARANGVALILERIKTLNTKDYPVFLMGDLNAEPETNLIKNLRTKMQDSRLISRQPPFGPEASFNDFKHQEDVTQLIDYIFVSQQAKVEVEKYALLTDSKNLRYPSDHFPVYIEVKWKK